MDELASRQLRYFVAVAEEAALAVELVLGRFGEQALPGAAGRGRRAVWGGTGHRGNGGLEGGAGAGAAVGEEGDNASEAVEVPQWASGAEGGVPELVARRTWPGPT